VALRQLKAADEDLPSLAAWMAAHERFARTDMEEDRHEHH